MHNRILYVVNSSLSSPTGGGRTRIVSAANEVSKYGFEVISLCFFPPIECVLRLGKLVTGKRSLNEELGCGSKVFYFPRLTFTRFGWISTLNEWFCGVFIFVVCLFYNIRVIHCHGVDSSTYALKARRIRNSHKIVADIHGVAAEEYLYERRISEYNTLARRLMKSELLVLKHADRLVFVSEAMRAHYAKKYQIRDDRVVVIPCATKTAGKELNSSRSIMRSKYDLHDKLVFCYIGSGEAYQLPKQMCSYFKTATSVFQNAFLLILSHHREIFERYLCETGVDPVDYRIEAVPHIEVFDILQVGDIGFLLRDDSIVNRVSSPTKFAEYCLSGVPVITTEWVGDISHIVRDRNLGTIVDLDDPELSDENVRFIQDVVNNRRRYSDKCSRFAIDEFSWETFGEHLSRVYAIVSR